MVNLCGGTSLGSLASAPTPGGQINLGNASKSVAGCILYASWRSSSRV